MKYTHNIMYNGKDSWRIGKERRNAEPGQSLTALFNIDRAIGEGKEGEASCALDFHPPKAASKWQSATRATASPQPTNRYALSRIRLPSTIPLYLLHVP